MKITVRLKFVYGNQLIYPVCDMAKVFTALIKKKTFDTEDLSNIKKLGYEISVETPQIGEQ